MLDSIYHMTLKYFCNRVFGVKISRFYHKYAKLLHVEASFYNVTLYMYPKTVNH